MHCTERMLFADAAGSAWMQLLLILFVAASISPVGCDVAPAAEPTTCQPVLLHLAGFIISSHGENVVLLKSSRASRLCRTDLSPR